MKEREFLEQICNMPVFTTKQVSAIIGDKNYSKVFLNRLLGRGLIRRVKRGFYTVHEDPVIYASHIYLPSYISLWYAFQYHGATTQLPVRIEVMSRKSESLDDIDFIRTNEMWGYSRVNYSGFNVFIADLEKAIIDAIATERLPLDEIQNAIRICDISTLESYSLRLPFSTAKKVGYTAETAGFFMEDLNLKVKKDRNYVKYFAAEEGNRWRVLND